MTEEPFCIIPTFGYYGEYHVLNAVPIYFNVRTVTADLIKTKNKYIDGVKTQIAIPRPEFWDAKVSRENANGLSQLDRTDTQSCVLLCLPNEVFLRMCTYYPETEQSLRMKAEERHKWLLKIRNQGLHLGVRIPLKNRKTLADDVVAEALRKMQKRVRLREQSKGGNSAFDEIRKKTTITFGGFTVTLPQRKETTEITQFMSQNEIRKKFELDDRSKNILKMETAA